MNKTNFLNKLTEFYWNFGISQNCGCGGQACYFWPNPRVIRKNSTIQDSQNTFKPKLACIFLPIRAKWSIQVCVETPCRTNNCWRFRKVLWPSQNTIWTLLVVNSNFILFQEGCFLQFEYLLILEHDHKNVYGTKAFKIVTK